VRVRAAALNGFDPMMLLGSTGLKTPFPMVPCGDFAGEIVEISGAEDSPFAVGDRVTGYPMLPDRGMMGEVTPGAACELLALPLSCLVPFSESLSYEKAAALPVAYGTAYRMMGERGQVKAGERVLVLGATGGVGAACIQLAKAAGAEVIACGSGSWKLDRLREIGADFVIDTSQEDFLSAVRERFGKPAYDGTGDGGVDVVVNYIGGDTWAKALKTVRRHGRVLVCGATAGYDPKTDLRYIWSFEQSIIGSNGWSIDDQSALMRLAADGKLDPVIHDVRPLEDLPVLMQDLIERRVFGKAVVTL
ncbi:MAG: zinc-binding dehydrogenase, partial [Pseudomonadota bacterium]